MAHFAELDENNIVLRVIVVSNADTSDANGVEKEYIGAAFCERLLGGRWVQTSYNGKFRKNYAGIGHFYDENLDAFIEPKPAHLPSHVLDEESGRWVPPVPKPDDGKDYAWIEKDLKWSEVSAVPRAPLTNEG